MEDERLKSAAEAILFAAGQSVPLGGIAKALGVSDKAAKELLEELKREYDRANRGIRLVQMENEYQMLSRGDYIEYIRRIIRGTSSAFMSQAALETLAIVAYRQAVTRSDVEFIRGVSSSSSLDLLIERGLVRPGEKLDIPGRPMGYETTGEFLKLMNLETLTDLPDFETFSEGLQLRLGENTEVENG